MDIIMDENDVKIENEDGESQSNNAKTGPIKDVNDILEYINRLISNAERRGDEYIILTSYRIHKDLNLRGSYPEVCSAMRMAIRRGDVILRECTPSDYSTLEIKYVLRTVKKKNQPSSKTPLEVIDEIASKALNYADATFTAIRYMIVLVLGAILLVVGVNLPTAIPIEVWGGRETAFMILTVIGGILFVAAEVSIFVYLNSLPVGTGAWFRSYANKARYAFSLTMVGVVVNAVCLICVSDGRRITASLLTAFVILSATFIAQAILCGIRVKK